MQEEEGMPKKSMREGLCVSSTPRIQSNSAEPGPHRWALKPAEYSVDSLLFLRSWRQVYGEVFCFVCCFKAAARDLQVSCKSHWTRLAAGENTPRQGQGGITKRDSSKTAALSHSTLQRKCATKCLLKHQLLKSPCIWFQLINTWRIYMKEVESSHLNTREMQLRWQACGIASVSLSI